MGSRSPSIARRNTERANSSGFTVSVAERLECQPRLVESGFQNDERLRIEGAVVEPERGSVPIYYGLLRVGMKE